MIRQLVQDSIRQSINENVGRGSAEHLFNSGALARVKADKNSHNTREIGLDIPIDLFLALAKKASQVSDRKLDNIKSHIDMGGKLDDVPYLLLDNNNGFADDWFVVGHEGRHRAIYLKSIGYSSMPVRFKSMSILETSRYIDNPNFSIDLIKNEDGNRSFRFNLSYSNGRFVTKMNSIKIL